ncbi:hypothetical protein SCB71_06215 [Herbiconiux sp. KACC 21604]|uniref:hypothetical protein n=1 Tax=unclassified Herbiconiux TaxID=2618217 RepID=UPI0014908D16|nr:hypothetical protein [Herbiconiux sp. SALV-R1]QJU52913.1 hypothetical protein HL652_04205 [Herbiconiux sp. SALV-R1]WPO87832.1 hypothetical protein SCB71_06215 [Herbiconiux sp. KACC 21604]
MADESNRRKLTASLARALAQVKAPIYVNEAGRKPFLVAFPGDRISTVMTAIRSLGGTATVFVSHGEAHPQAVIVMSTEATRNGNIAQLPVTLEENGTVADIEAYFKKHEGVSSATFRLSTGAAEATHPQPFELAAA